MSAAVIETPQSIDAVAAGPASAAPLLPLELVDKAIGARIWVILRNNQGTRERGFCCLIWF